MTAPETRPAPAWLGPAIDWGPVLAFFAAYLRFGIVPATGVLLGATLVALGLGTFYRRKIAPLTIVTAVVVAIFGGLTLVREDETFIKMKPTIVQALLGAVLLLGLAVGRSWLKWLLGSAWNLDDRGWKKLTLRFSLFFLAMAALNEAVWRTQSTDVWVNFKVFGLLALTVVFVLAQARLIERHRTEGGETAPAPPDARE